MDNYLLNTFRFAQRQARATLTGYTTDKYCFDRWFLQHNGGGSDIQTRVWEIGDSTPPASFSNVGWYGQVKNNAGSATGLLLCQPVEAKLAVASRSRSIRWSLSAIGSSTGVNLKMAVFEWTGTADSSSAKSLVASWSGDVPTFNTTTLAILGQSSYVLNATSWANCELTTTTGANTNNLIAALWVEGLAAGVSLFLQRPGLARTIVQDFVPRHTELEECKRYYQKSYALGTAPGTASQAPGRVDLSGVSTGNEAIRVPVSLGDSMRVAPTVTLYDRAGNSGKLTSIASSSLTDNVSPSTGAENISESGFVVNHADTGLNGVAFHWEADAEL